MQPFDQAINGLLMILYAPVSVNVLYRNTLLDQPPGYEDGPMAIKWFLLCAHERDSK
jgi:hypothetical protein